MTTSTIIDSAALVEDLRMASAYASRVGLLRNPQLLASLKTAEQTVKEDESPDIGTLTLALNDVAQVIAPITLADLRFGRDPFTPSIQKRTKILQLCLAVLAVAILALIGDFMHSLRTEEIGLKALREVQAMHPQQKLTALRKMAQNEGPLDRSNTFFDVYHQQLGELKEINNQIVLSRSKVEAATRTTMVPLGLWQLWQLLRPLEKEADDPAIAAAVPNGTRDVEATASDRAGDPAAASDAASAPNGELMNAATMNQLAAQAVEESGVSEGDFCASDTEGGLRLPEDVLKYPVWMQILIADLMNDFCFQLKVLFPVDEPGSLLSNNLEHLVSIPEIERKVTLRANWFLPFLFGVLGAIIFVMRNSANVRTPAMELFPILMRVSLGGVAGIVMGWFSTAALPTLESAGALSVPFALAFLTGYGIDALFNVLDRLSRVASDGSAQKT